jgi:alpha-ribazole phosphatase
MPVTLLRHTTPAVAAGVCYGISDLDVADSFHDEAQVALDSLPPIDRIVSSPLLRCQRLANHIAAARQLPVSTDPRLREMDFGTWENRAWVDIPRAELDLWATDFFHARPHGGESVAMLTARTREAIADCENPQDHALIVTHAGVIKAVLANSETATAYAATISFGGFVTLIPPFTRGPA